jgi:hypothetical protein
MDPLAPTEARASYEGRRDFKSPSFSEDRLSLAAPVFRSGGGDVLGLSLSGGRLRLGEPVELSDHTRVPVDLYRLQAGAQYVARLPERRGWSLRGLFGAAGDKLSDSRSYGLAASYGFPGAGKGYWVVMVFLSNNSPLPNFIPIPGVIYIYRTETFTGMFGLPFASMRWMPEPAWTLSFSLFGPIVTLEAARGERDRPQGFVRLTSTQENFILSKRSQPRDRLTVAEKRASLGLRSPLWGPVRAELQLGSAFDRSLYVGQAFRKKSGTASLPSDAFISWSLISRF